MFVKKHRLSYRKERYINAPGVMHNAVIVPVRATRCRYQPRAWVWVRLAWPGSAAQGKPRRRQAGQAVALRRPGKTRKVSPGFEKYCTVATLPWHREYLVTLDTIENKSIYWMWLVWCNSYQSITQTTDDNVFGASLRHTVTTKMELVMGMDSFTVSLYSPNGRHLPAVRAVQRDCHWLLKSGGNPCQSREPIIHVI